ncbi:MAG: hypothetical protein LAT81_03360 [Oceanicaulis sp.]|nr:hypothetical protein [Oceanicaulis sp.]
MAHGQPITPPAPIDAETPYAKGPGVVAIQFETAQGHVLSALHALLVKRDHSVWTLIARTARFPDSDIDRTKTQIPADIEVSGFCEVKFLWRLPDATRKTTPCQDAT